MRKVNLKIKVRTMVPIISTVEAIVLLDEGHTNMEQIARHVIRGNEPSYMTIEDSGLEEIEVEDGDSSDISEQILDYLSDAPRKVFDVQVVDSR